MSMGFETERQKQKEELLIERWDDWRQRAKEKESSSWQCDVGIAYSI